MELWTSVPWADRALHARRVEWNYTRSRFIVSRLDTVSESIDSICLQSPSKRELTVPWQVAQDWTAASVTDLPQLSHAG